MPTKHEINDNADIEHFLGRPSHSSQEPLAAAAEVEGLSRREREILELLADGLPNKEIAARAGLTDGTVRWHRVRLFPAVKERGCVADQPQQADIAYGGMELPCHGRLLRLASEAQPRSVRSLTARKSRTRWHLRHVYDKLHVRSRTEAALKFKSIQAEGSMAP